MPVVAELLHADRQTDDVTVVFRNCFANASETNYCLAPGGTEANHGLRTGVPGPAR